MRTYIRIFFTIFFSKNVFASGYTIDLRENNPIYQEQFDKFELVFNFEKRTVNQIVKLSKKYRDNISLFQEINMNDFVKKIVYDIFDKYLFRYLAPRNGIGTTISCQVFSG